MRKRSRRHHLSLELRWLPFLFGTLSALFPISSAFGSDSTQTIDASESACRSFATDHIQSEQSKAQARQCCELILNSDRSASGSWYYSKIRATHEVAKWNLVCTESYKLDSGGSQASSREALRVISGTNSPLKSAGASSFSAPSGTGTDPLIYVFDDRLNTIFVYNSHFDGDVAPERALSLSQWVGSQKISALGFDSSHGELLLLAADGSILRFAGSADSNSLKKKNRPALIGIYPALQSKSRFLGMAVSQVLNKAYLLTEDGSALVSSLGGASDASVLDLKKASNGTSFTQISVMESDPSGQILLRAFQASGASTDFVLRDALPKAPAPVPSASPSPAQ